MSAARPAEMERMEAVRALAELGALPRITGPEAEPEVYATPGR
jgi:hypothetical protein